MACIPFPVAALAATAVLAIACTDARAQTGDAASDPAQPSGVTETALQDTTATATPPGTGGPTSPSDVVATHSAPQEPPVATGTAVVGTITPAPSATGPAPPTPASGQETLTPVSSQDGAADAPSQRLTKEIPPASAPAAPQASGVTGGDPQTQQAAAPSVTSPVPVAPPVKPGPLPSREGSLPAEGVEQLLSDVGRRLHEVQGKMDDLRHSIAQGEPPPKRHLIDLRASLGQIAPMLAALEASLDIAGQLSPHLRQVLHRVSDDLRGVRAGAADLIAALGRSGARSAEVRMLLRELEHFRTFHLALPSLPAVGPPQIPSPARVSGGYVAVQPAPAVSPPPAAAPTPDHHPVGSEESASHEGGGSGKAPPAPWSAAPGSATASPAGTFLFAAVASLAMLLFGLLLPRLCARVDQRPGRRYQVALLAPLERPG